MREIKFRAWEIEKEEMISVDDISFNGDGLINTRGAWRAFSEVELMQYTGLKDKYDVEIYEGDFLRFILQEMIGGYFKETQHLEPVKYSEGAFWVGDYLLCNVMVEDEELMTSGNIYEYPELLEEVQQWKHL